MRKGICIAFWAWLQLVAICAAEVTAERAIIATGYKSAEIVGESVVFDAETLKTESAAIITVGENDGLLEVQRQVKIGEVTFWTDADDYELQPLGDRFRFTGPEGVYRISAVDFASKTKSAVVVQLGKQQDPEPDPTPDNPLSGFKDGWFVVVYETSAVEPWIAKIFNAQAWQLSMKTSRNIKWVWRDDDLPETQQRYAGEIAAVGLPLLVVMDDSGKRIAAMKLPKTVEAIEEMLK